MGDTSTMRPLILSLFPGIDLLGRAFEAEWPEACLVRGPDLLWGGDIKTFHPPAGKFDGVIGGPPCQFASVLQHAIPQRPVENLIPEFERCIAEAAPSWFLMENVPLAPEPVVRDYIVKSLLYNNRWSPEAPEQNRLRRFSFGTLDGRALLPETTALDNPTWEYAVVAGHGGKDRGRQKWGQGTQLPAKMCRLQGLPEDFFRDSPFTIHAQRKLLGNGVPLPMGRAIARAVRQALA